MAARGCIVIAVLNQILLAAFGLTALWLSMGDNPVGRKFAPLIGLGGQPFWFSHALEKESYGVLVLACAYSAVYVHGAWRHWGPK